LIGRDLLPRIERNLRLCPVGEFSSYDPIKGVIVNNRRNARLNDGRLALKLECSAEERLVLLNRIPFVIEYRAAGANPARICAISASVRRVAAGWRSRWRCPARLACRISPRRSTMKTGPPIASSAASSALNATVNPPGHLTSPRIGPANAIVASFTDLRR
jgi:hypothetical protein